MTEIDRTGSNTIYPSFDMGTSTAGVNGDSSDADVTTGLPRDDRMLPTVISRGPPTMNAMSVLHFLRENIGVFSADPKAGPAVIALLAGAFEALGNGSGRINAETVNQALAALEGVDPEVAKAIVRSAQQHLRFDAEGKAAIDAYLDRPEDFAPLLQAFLSEHSMAGDKLDALEMRMLAAYAREDDGQVSDAERNALRRLLADVPMTEEAREVYRWEFESDGGIMAPLYGVPAMTNEP